MEFSFTSWNQRFCQGISQSFCTCLVSSQQKTLLRLQVADFSRWKSSVSIGSRTNFWLRSSRKTSLSHLFPAIIPSIARNAISFIKRSWKTPFFLSTRPFAWGECASMIRIPNFLHAFPKAVKGSSPARSSATVVFRLMTYTFLRSV